MCANYVQWGVRILMMLTTLFYEKIELPTKWTDDIKCIKQKLMARRFDPNGVFLQ